MPTESRHCIDVDLSVNDDSLWADICNVVDLITEKPKHNMSNKKCKVRAQQSSVLHKTGEQKYLKKDFVLRGIPFLLPKVSQRCSVSFTSKDFKL